MSCMPLQCTLAGAAVWTCCISLGHQAFLASCADHGEGIDSRVTFMRLNASGVLESENVPAPGLHLAQSPRP
jgi:hypothetical protein